MYCNHFSETILDISLRALFSILFSVSVLIISLHFSAFSSTFSNYLIRSLTLVSCLAITISAAATFFLMSPLFLRTTLFFYELIICCRYGCGLGFPWTYGLFLCNETRSLQSLCISMISFFQHKHMLKLY